MGASEPTDIKNTVTKLSHDFLSSNHDSNEIRTW